MVHLVQERVVKPFKAIISDSGSDDGQELVAIREARTALSTIASCVGGFESLVDMCEGQTDIVQLDQDLYNAELQVTSG